jgi:hypothetical protein
MAALWVIRVDLLARLADLFDNNEILVLLNDLLDLRLDMSGNDDEPISLIENRLVGLRVNVDLLEAPWLRTLAMQRHRGSNVMESCTLLDLAVHIANKLLVPCCTLIEVHRVGDKLVDALTPRC